MAAASRRRRAGPTGPGGATRRPAHARAPRSAGLAGIAFSILFSASLLLPSVPPPADLPPGGFLAWFQANGITPTTISALYLAPFAGIAFLWFIGVIRDRVGDREDRFFSTVFLGSGLLFVAMYWCAAALLASLVATDRFDDAQPLNATTLETVRSVAFSFLFVLAARAAGVFMIVTSTIALRTHAFPRALALIGYAIALVMLLSLSSLHLIVLAFPAWVFIASVYLLVAERRAAAETADGLPVNAAPG